jgi:hypothetical protein
MPRKPREAVKLTTHLPQGQKQWVQEQAQKNFTSINAEIIRCIRIVMASETGVAS